MNQQPKSRLKDAGDIACCVVVVVVSLSAIAWLWWTVIAMFAF
jgi:hypothetical protein